MKCFITLHEIVLPKDSYQITNFDIENNNIIINYSKLKINYLLNDSKLYLKLIIDPI